ncbi:MULTISPECIES: tryptophan 2,3-dioxygenase [Glycomyces]|uniref:Tryptophan 2,3-dioxygenase n=2 Tax=Glycomyces TaxID=58113 RepID=A0A9X3PJA7_9ACTN|nr:tryptophan 2,3-dioxygenase family protein [Glycomyces lechevalierae]MDA1386439.1 tryptophan 2,3-dioxygenase family protein [Glycomyces lechevalierae]MDR7338955.1 tryptophan 2,3-dioxygenase [Glycomyces lechevalierae]
MAEPQVLSSRDPGGEPDGARLFPAGEHRALTYSSYLALDELLAAQRPRSEEHDEMLFIVIHQTYELWFKQLLHELAHLQERLETGDGQHALRTLKRLLAILGVLVEQVHVLETMTPLQFKGFRGRLEDASGFQSAQFRELEAVLGRRDPRVLQQHPEGEARQRIAAAMARPSLYDSFLAYLALSGYEVPPRADLGAPLEPSAETQRVLLQVYRDDGEPSQVAERMVDIDEAVQEWRYRHVKMVQRTIGGKRGTGGSSGAGYLMTTLHTPAFPDLWEVRSDI